jgi:hypothetical protein
MKLADTFEARSWRSSAAVCPGASCVAANPIANNPRRDLVAVFMRAEFMPVFAWPGERFFDNSRSTPFSSSFRFLPFVRMNLAFPPLRPWRTSREPFPPSWRRLPCLLYRGFPGSPTRRYSRRQASSLSFLRVRPILQNWVFGFYQTTRVTALDDSWESLPEQFPRADPRVPRSNPAIRGKRGSSSPTRALQISE